MKNYSKRFAEWVTGSRRISRLRAQFAHDLRNPLSIMRAELELALREETLSEQEMRRVLKSNIEEVDRMTRILEKLLNSTSADSNK